jgi:curved DNA-binding protein CbpA
VVTDYGDRGFDAYKVLQVDREAEPEVIQAAFRRLAQKWHPDVATTPEGRAEAAGRMVAINRAWAILGDPSRRRTYDADRAGGRPQPGADTAAGPPPGRPSGSVLTFGRYAGWSLGEIARSDVEYVEWLDRMPIGRPYRDEIDALLRKAGRRRSETAEAADRHGLFRRR